MCGAQPIRKLHVVLHNTMCYSFCHLHLCIWDVPYHAKLGLQLNLQGLQGPLELADLSARGLECLCVG